MRALLLVISAVVGLGICGCSKKDAGTAGEATTQGASKDDGMTPGSDVTRQPGTEAVPMADVPQVPVAGISMNPYFDEAGTQTEVAVGAGEQFKLYVMGSTVEPYPTASAQLRVQLPPGVRVLYTVETEHKMSSLGQYDFNYMVAYDCQPPGRFIVVSYVCQVNEDFQGGEIHILPGFLADNATFLGFATCEFGEIRAAGGTATVRKK